MFNPKAKPWIDIEGAEAERIREQVRLCPSGALSLPDESKKPPMNNEKQSLKVTPNGPVLVTGECEVEMPDGTKEVKSNVALCRCGASSNKPYCDGTHSRIDFKG